MWEAVALVLEIDPRSLREADLSGLGGYVPLTNAGPVFARSSFPNEENRCRFDEALNFAERASAVVGPIHLSSGSGAGVNKRTALVSLAEVAAFFVDCDWPNIPAPLLALLSEPTAQPEPAPVAHPEPQPAVVSAVAVVPQTPPKPRELEPLLWEPQEGAGLVRVVPAMEQAAQAEPVAAVVPAESVAALVAALPDKSPDKGREMKRAALIHANFPRWESIERDLKDAAANGLTDRAKAGHGHWWEGLALAWAEEKGKLKDTPAAGSPGMIHRIR